MSAAPQTQMIQIASSGDEGADYEMIENVAHGLVSAGFEPMDAEPGEWLQLQRGGHIVEIAIVGELADPETNPATDVVMLDPDTADPDARGRRTVPMSQTFTVHLPKAFYDDHVQRD